MGAANAPSVSTLSGANPEFINSRWRITCQAIANIRPCPQVGQDALCQNNVRANSLARVLNVFSGQPR
jgi:hypothetical protein